MSDEPHLPQFEQVQESLWNAIHTCYWYLEHKETPVAVRSRCVDFHATALELINRNANLMMELRKLDGKV